MNLRLLITVLIFAAASVVAFAQSDKPNAQFSKPTVEDAQKFVQTISSDKEKLKAYCDIAKLDEQLDKAEENFDVKEFEALVAKRDTLEQQLGPDYIRVIDGLGDVEPNSAEGQKFTAVFEPLHKKCGTAPK
jgi:hypothetical protein